MVVPDGDVQKPRGERKKRMARKGRFLHTAVVIHARFAHTVKLFNASVRVRGQRQVGTAAAVHSK